MTTAIETGPRITETAKPAPTPEAAGTPTFRQLLPWAAASSLLLYLCYFPVAWGWLGWVALVPLCNLVRSRARTRSIFLASYVCGLLFFFPALQWMRVADPRMYFTWFLLAIYCSIYIPAGIFFVRALDRRRIPLVLSLPIVWTALDLLRAHVMGGFSWYFLGHTQHDFLPIIQVSDVTGAYGVTFLVAAVNAVVFEWGRHLARCSDGVRRPVLVFQSAAVLLVFAGFFLYGAVRMNQAEFEPGPKLALVQGDVDQQIRKVRNSTDDDARLEARNRMRADYNTLGRIAARQRPDLIVYPETSYPDEWQEIHTATPELLNAQGWAIIREARELLAHIIRAHADGTHRPLVLIGLNTTEHYPEQTPPRLRFNTALLVRPEGEPLRYDKIHRVPFGEFVPLRDVLPLMDRFAPYDYDYSIAPGREQSRLPIGKHRFGVLICYEDTDTTLARRYVAPGDRPKADFLVNISNDGWFDGTAEHEEHLAICRFRAVEARRSIVRSVNMGISAVIDGNGRVLDPEPIDREKGANEWEVGLHAKALPTGRWGEFKKTAGVLFAAVPLDTRGSVYAAWGDWLPWTCWGLLALCLAALRGRPSSEPTHAGD